MKINHPGNQKPTKNLIAGSVFEYCGYFYLVLGSVPSCVKAINISAVWCVNLDSGILQAITPDAMVIHYPNAYVRLGLGE